MPVEGVDHYTVLTDDVAATQHFYCDLLGLTVGWRPDFDFPGAWLYAGGHPIVHVVAGRPIPGKTTGAVDHVAFKASGDPAELSRRLTGEGIKNDLRTVVGTGIRQVFCLDPSGVRVELNYPAA
jgi:catechol 2,3-dioxygenase-like lactoylglutathione lyase family enzyme